MLYKIYVAVIRAVIGAVIVADNIRRKSLHYDEMVDVIIITEQTPDHLIT